MIYIRKVSNSFLEEHRSLKVIFIVPYPIEGASSRLRVWQYLKHLERLGVRCCFRPFMSSAFYEIVYQPGRFWLKTYHFILSAFNRLLDLPIIKKHDLVFVQREAFPFGPPIFEWIVAKILRKPLIYDFDDAIFLKTKSKYNNLVRFVKSPQKISKIIRMSTQVIVGNKYLQEYALKFNQSTSVIVTPVDTEKFKPEDKKANKDNVVLGWIGSHSTSTFLLPLRDVFQRLQAKYPCLTLRFVGAGNLFNQIPFAQFWEWKLERESKDLNTFDVGIMPLPENEWSKGKCGYKLLQYMGAGIPVVCSPIGVNKEIVQEGGNGFFAGLQEEWFKKLSALIEDSEMRQRMGIKGRKTVENRYSLKACLPSFYEVLKKSFESVCPKK